ncbi:hypothetical protein [Erythrobacter sp.]|uniref:hypothetical protein n=1 Tax=Erythrobacter sp. TaxID=1042 RepID=UPI001B1B9F43|nr:hypothetical protein [Erythrobacter sp.]MBO6526766.1 hypothetical protein [Erythrobacter sp.]MBO6528439.1 hypothetical protein [Erythrobacter sp.]
MKKIYLVLAALALSPTVVSAQESASIGTTDVELQLAHEIVAIAYPESEREAMFQGVSEQMEAQLMRSMGPLLNDPGALAIVEDFQKEVAEDQKPILKRHIPLLMDAWAQGYAEIFSEQELRDILAFVTTKTGSSFMLKSAEVMTNPQFAAANEAYMSEAMAVVFAKMPALVEAMTEYKESQIPD